jgi:hypothetical protein
MAKARLRSRRVSSLGHHVLLALSVAALASAGLRTASLVAPRGLERAVAGATFAAAFAGLEAMGLGLVDLGGSWVALGLAAAATWAAALLALPAPALSVGAELSAWWREAPPATRIAVGAVGGAGLAWAVWLVRHPALGFDSVQYHIPEAVTWVRDGNPGAPISGILSGVTNLPLMSEVLLAWQVGIARSLVPVSLWAPATMLLLASSGWLGLRTIGVGRAATATAVAALCATPIVTHYQMNGAYNDLPALAWLVAAAALTAGSRRNTLLLVPALLAGGLAAGTKTTVLPMTVFLLALGLWWSRDRLHAVARPLAFAAAPALVLGGLWYVRDFVRHGSPFWPDVGTPWGDPVPYEAPSFLDRPRETLDRFLDDYVDVFAGGIVLFVGALLAPFVAGRRAVWVAGATTAVSLLLWLNAPATGAAESGSVVGTLSTLRYILPAVAAAITTLALTTRTGGPVGAVAGLVLAVALVINVVQTRDLGFPSVPSVFTPLAGAALGAGAVLAVSALPPPPLPRLAACVAGLALLVLAGAALAAGAPGFLERHAKANAHTVYPYAAMIGWLAAQPDYRNRGDPVAMVPIPNGSVVGDRLEHRLEFIPLHEPCARVRARLRRQWLLINYLGIIRRFTAARCLAGVRPSFSGSGFRAYRPVRRRPRAATR